MFYGINKVTSVHKDLYADSEDPDQTGGINE